MKRILIKPLNNLFVSNPFTKLRVKAEGEETIDHIHWRRLEKNGDISIEEIKDKKTKGSSE